MKLGKLAKAVAAMLIVPIAALGIGLGVWSTSAFAEGLLPVNAPAPAIDEPATAATETAVFAGGCFWGVQGVFQHVKGVKSAVAGYSGGTVDNPSYEMVGSETTGHAESVKVEFDPKVVSYGKLLQIFFSVVTDPTTLNYRATITARATARPCSSPTTSRPRWPGPTSTSSMRPRFIRAKS